MFSKSKSRSLKLVDMPCMSIVMFCLKWCLEGLFYTSFSEPGPLKAISGGLSHVGVVSVYVGSDSVQKIIKWFRCHSDKQTTVCRKDFQPNNSLIHIFRLGLKEGGIYIRHCWEQSWWILVHMSSGLWRNYKCLLLIGPTRKMWVCVHVLFEYVWQGSARMWAGARGSVKAWVWISVWAVVYKLDKSEVWLINTVQWTGGGKPGKL